MVEFNIRNEKGQFVKGHIVPEEWKIKMKHTLPESTKKEISRKLRELWRNPEWRKKQIKARANRKPIREVNLLPSKELSYIIGVVYGDGCIYHSRHSYNITLVCKDKDFALTFLNALKKICESKPYLWRQKGWKGNYYFHTEISSKKLYKFLSNRSLHKEVIFKFPADFIRGFFDSEGTVGEKNYSISACNTKKEILEITKKCLSKLGIYSLIYPVFSKKYRKGCIYILFIGRRESVEKFYQKVNFSIERKRTKLKKIIDSFKPLKYTLEDYKKVIKLRKLGFTAYRISKITKLPYSVVENWVLYNQKPRRYRWQSNLSKM